LIEPNAALAFDLGQRPGLAAQEEIREQRHTRPAEQ
jgi:hypothetical protein